MLAELLEEMHQILEVEGWYDARFRAAALTKYRRIEGMLSVVHSTGISLVASENSRAEEHRLTSNEKDESDTDEKWDNKSEKINNSVIDETKDGSEAVYSRLKRICTALTSEIDKDLRIQNSKVLPSTIKLPRITTRIFCQVNWEDLWIVSEVTIGTEEPAVAVDG